MAPGAELRRWFGHEPERFREFAARYRRELRSGLAAKALADLVSRASEGPVTLVYGAHDEIHNGAMVLRAVIEAALGRGRQHSRKDAARIKSPLR